MWMLILLLYQWMSMLLTGSRFVSFRFISTLIRLQQLSHLTASHDHLFSPHMRGWDERREEEREERRGEAQPQPEHHHMAMAVARILISEAWHGSCIYMSQDSTHTEHQQSA